jgi:DNA-binding FadR family transcriptional regulator
MFSDTSQTSARTNIRQKAAADRDSIYSSIMNQIRTGHFAEGSKLPTERELCVTFGAARNAVRQALEALEREGVVSRQVGRGTFVTPQAAMDTAHGGMSAGLSLQEILEVRVLLEPQAARLVIERATERDFEAMERCLEGIRNARDWSDHKEWKYELHLTMMRATQNRLLVQIFETIIRARRQDQWGRIGDTRNIPHDVRAATLDANERIVDALRDGRVSDASEAIRGYLNGIFASFHGI